MVFRKWFCYRSTDDATHKENHTCQMHCCANLTSVEWCMCVVYQIYWLLVWQWIFWYCFEVAVFIVVIVVVVVALWNTLVKQMSKWIKHILKREWETKIEIEIHPKTERNGIHPRICCQNTLERINIIFHSS